MPLTKATRPGRQPPPQKEVERRGRECAHPGCRTKLSMYNRSERCWQHAEVVFPNHRGKRLRIDRS